MNDLTGEKGLIILNSHIDNVIKGTCGQSNDEPSWGLNEINNIINCIAIIKKDLDELKAHRQQASLMKEDTQKEPPEDKGKKGK